MENDIDYISQEEFDRLVPQLEQNIGSQNAAQLLMNILGGNQFEEISNNNGATWF